MLNKMFSSVVALGLVSLSSSVFAQDMSKVEIKTRAVAGSVFMLQGAGGNIGLSVGEDGVLIVDDQFAPLSNKIKAAIAKLSRKPSRYLLNTHWHYDHTGGNGNFNSADTILVAHNNVRKRMQQGGVIKAFGKTVEPAKAHELPELTFDNNINLYFNGEQIHAEHMSAAHTDGDAVVYFRKSNVVHMGDLYFNGIFPFVDLSSGGSVTGLLEGVTKALAKMDDGTKVIPGHGALSNKAELQAYADMISLSVGKIGEAKKRGNTLEQIKANNPIRELDEKWGKGFIKLDMWTSFVYHSL